METSDMKNMIVLKNLPSNMVEEAIIIFKESQKVKQKELVDKRNNISFENKPKSRDYILKEAEMLVTDYINKLENRKKLNNSKSLNQYKKLQRYSITVTIFLIVSIILNFI